MSKSVSLKELPKLFIESGLSLSELCEYLEVRKELIQEWERFFNLFPTGGDSKEKIYSQKRIIDFMKIKDSVTKGMPLHEIKNKLFKINSITNPITNSELNPFENPVKVVELKQVAPENNEIMQFLTQINRANEKIGELILEKARMVEETAIEKANLMAEINVLKTRNIELITEKENIFAIIREKEEQIKSSCLREENLVKTLKNAQDMLKQKEDEMILLKDQLDSYEHALQEKNKIIYNQSIEIDKLIEKQNKKWWNRLREIFF